MTTRTIMLLTFAATACGGAGPDDSCTVRGERVVCDDGTSLEMPAQEEQAGSAEDEATGATSVSGEQGAPGADGATGEPGAQGATGPSGADGADGVDGTNCTVVDTDDGARIDCDDGTSVVVADGADGEDGAIGATGATGHVGPAGGATYASGSRLDVWQLDGEDGSTWADPRLWDSELEVFCSPGRYVDGSVRCLPLYQAEMGLCYIDPEKTQWLAADRQIGAYGARYGVHRVVFPGNVHVDPYPEEVTFYRLANAYESDAVTGEAWCSQQGPSAGLLLYEIGAEVPATEFVLME